MMASEGEIQEKDVMEVKFLFNVENLALVGKSVPIGHRLYAEPGHRTALPQCQVAFPELSRSHEACQVWKAYATVGGNEKEKGRNQPREVATSVEPRLGAVLPRFHWGR